MNEVFSQYNPPVSKLQKVGRDLGERLRGQGIHCLFDLLRRVPEHYIEPATVVPIDRIPPAPRGEHHILGRVQLACECFGARGSWFEIHAGLPQSALLKATLDPVDLKRAAYYVRAGDFALFSGTLTGGGDGGWRMHNPVYTPLGGKHPWPLHRRDGLLYPPLEGIPHGQWRRLLGELNLLYSRYLDHLIDPAELARLGLKRPSQALMELHGDWPSGETELFNQGRSPAHQTLAWLAQNLR